MLKPENVAAAAEMIRDEVVAGRMLRPLGGGTKMSWSNPETVPHCTDIHTSGLNRIVEHNAGDFTAVVEAGMRFSQAQRVFAASGQMLALDPPLGSGDGATIGGVIATNDSGPMRHRYGSARDLVLGVTAILSDGTVTKSGGTVIKNVAGYDLAKLFTGSFGTLGMIARVAVRLHPLPAGTATLVANSNSPTHLAAAAADLMKLPLEADAMDLVWHKGEGKLLVRFAGAAAEERAITAKSHLKTITSIDTLLDDTSLWNGVRNSQRLANDDGVVVKVAGRSTELVHLIGITQELGGSLVSRAGLGLSWVTLPSHETLSGLRRALPQSSVTILDGVAPSAERWPAVAASTLSLMQRVKSKFDPAGAFRPGTFVGGI